MAKKTIGVQIQEAFADNVYINFVLSPVYFVGLNILLVYHFRMPFLSNGWLDSALSMSIASTAFYLYVSKFFQPDLDHHTKRPGMNCFPFFPTWQKYLGIRILSVLLNPIRIGEKNYGLTWLWDSYWKGFALLFTHRGLPHWPILGVWLRISWILLWYYGIQFAILVSLGKVYPVPFLLDWAMAFFPGTKGFGSVGFFLFCFPVYMSDFFHLVGDVTESRLKHKPFFRPQGRGFFWTMTFGLVSRIRNVVSKARNS